MAHQQMANGKCCGDAAVGCSGPMCHLLVCYLLLSPAVPEAPVGAAGAGAPGGASVAVTGAPGRSLGSMSVMTRSPSLRPLVMSQPSPRQSPVLTERISALLSAETV